MMKQRVTSALAALGIVLLLGMGTAQAQYTPPAQPPGPFYPRTSTPRLSPYLNLLRGGDPAANYFLGVVPERQQRVLNSQFESAIGTLDRRTAAGAETVIDDVRPRGLPPTGHSVRFLNASPYYLSPTSAQGVGAPTTGLPATRGYGR
jgi:hypothetical protein